MTKIERQISKLEKEKALDEKRLRAVEKHIESVRAEEIRLRKKQIKLLDKVKGNYKFSKGDFYSVPSCKKESRAAILNTMELSLDSYMGHLSREYDDLRRRINEATQDIDRLKRMKGN